MAQTPTPATPQGDADPSMDDILASIRRILSDEEKAAKAQAPADGVLRLDPSMMVPDETAARPSAGDDGHHADPHEGGAYHDADDFPVIAAASEHKPGTEGSEAESERVIPPLALPAAVPVYGAPPPLRDGEALVAPDVAALAASSVGALMRTLISERNAVVHRGGPSIEDLVREEIRPLLKAWLDLHLPGLVERQVRAEIERVVGRVTG